MAHFKALLLSRPFFFLLMLAGLFITIPAASAQECVYTIYVQTGDREDAGTDAVVSLVISDHDGAGKSVVIPDLEKWGQMGAGYDYFERGHLDFFSGSTSCLSGPACWMMLAHDNSGNKPGWYVDYVLVTVSLAPAGAAVNQEVDQHLFKVDQWLARDESPNQLATIRDDCAGDSSFVLGRRMGSSGEHKQQM